jgi:hypothetical protein
MIGRRIAQHMKQQHWTGVLIELVIVILGVFIGLQVDNWNQARQEYQQQHAVQARLLSDFKLLDDQVNQAIDENNRLIVAIDTLRQAIKRGKALPGDDTRITYALNRLNNYPTFIRFSSTYTELVSSGKLDLIKSEKLRIALAHYDEAARNGLYNLTSIQRMMDANFVNEERFVTLAPLDMQHLSVDMVTDYDIGAMAKNEAFRNSVKLVYVLQVFIHSNLIFQKQSVERVLKVMGKLGNEHEIERTK